MVNFLKQRPCLREVSPEGCECWTPSLDSPGRLGGRSQPCALTTVPSVYSFFALGELSNLDPRPFIFRFSLTTPTAGDFMGWAGGRRVHRLRMRPTRPHSQSDCRRRHLAANHRRQPARLSGELRWRPRPEEASSAQLNSSGLIPQLPRAGEPQTALTPPPTWTGKDWGVVQPKQCLTAKGRDSRVPTHTSPGSVGRPVTAPGPSGGSMPQDPEASGCFRPLPSLVWAGSALQKLSSLGDRTSQLPERAS